MKKYFIQKEWLEKHPQLKSLEKNKYPPPIIIMT